MIPNAIPEAVIPVSNLGRAIEFYRDTVGLEVCR